MIVTLLKPWESHKAGAALKIDGKLGESLLRAGYANAPTVTDDLAKTAVPVGESVSDDEAAKFAKKHGVAYTAPRRFTEDEVNKK